MLIEFTQDYCGRETAMLEYKKGEQIAAPFAQAVELVNLGIAKEVVIEDAPPVKKSKGKKSEVINGEN